MTRTRFVAGLAAVLLLGAACSRSSKPTTAASSPTAAAAAATTSTSSPGSCNVPLTATDVGVTPTTITIEVMADVGSSLAPGLFQGNLDAINAFAAYLNQRGGLACRHVVVRTWDSKLDPTESKDGQLDACANAFALVGTNALFNPDPSPMTNCVDKTGRATGLPDVAAIAADVNEQCAPTVFNIQGVPFKCPVTPGPVTDTQPVGFFQWALQQVPGLHGLFLVAGDLPSTIQTEVPAIAAAQQAGITWDATPKVSGADTQPAYTPRVELAKAKNSNFVYDGSNDVAMVRMRKEADAQGLTSVKLWACTTACYTKAFLAQGGADVEGTYVALGFLPFEEAAANAEDQAYVNAIGPSKVDSFGAYAWQAAVAFQTAVDTVVSQDGPNGLTRANMFQALKGVTNFTANGWLGTKSLQGSGAISSCYLVMQVENGRFVRVYPTKPGTMDCGPANLLTETIDPVAAAAKIK